MAAFKTLWINARFLTRRTTGVERVARELLSIWAAQTDDQGYWDAKKLQLRLIAPPTPTPLENPWSSLPLHQIGRFQGHLWEQMDLPWYTRSSDGLLLNLCNTAPWFKRKQWVFLHDAQTFAIPDNFTRSMRLWYQWMFRLVGHGSEGILTNSQFSRSELVRYVGLNPKAIHVMPLGADHMDRIQPSMTEKLKTLFSHLGNKPFILAVSSTNPNKNFGAVIQALEYMGHQAPACVMVGQQYDKVFAKVALNPEKIHHLGYVSDEELAYLYGKASVLAYPSFYEGFGLPPIEAMWFGCPVVVSKTSSLPEVCGDAAHYCDPYDPKDLARVLLNLLKDTNQQIEMRQKGFHHARRFSWHQTAMNMIDTILHHPSS